MRLKIIYGGVLTAFSKLFGVDFAKKFDTALRFRRSLNLRNPVSLADKVTYLELHDQSPLAAECTDKYAVRQYIKDKGLEEILVPLVGGPWNTIKDIDFSTLPESFVLKATHGCKMNYLVPEKEKLGREKCRKEMDKWLKTTYGTYSMEPHYEKIPHRIYAEKYLADADRLVDYKFHCMNGVPQFVLVCSDRVVTETGNQICRHIFDMDWRTLDGLTDQTKNEVKKPEHFGQMIEIAKKLSADFKFVRVDLYDIDGKVYFGELTFTPTNGVFSHYTKNFLMRMENKLSL